MAAGRLTSASPSLAALGWSGFFAAQLGPGDEGALAARVCRQDVNQWHLLSADGRLTAQLAGRLRQQAASRADLPTVGDWVLVREAGRDGIARIERRLERKSGFSRREAGREAEEQLLAANLDWALIVCGLDGEFNANRVERYLLLCEDTGAKPAILLNKADLCRNPQKRLAAVQSLAQGAPALLLSALKGEGFAALQALMAPGSASALIGSSGVGKSTIVNRLLGEARFRTGPVRQADSKGRHTTSFRELALLPSGALVVDTPGLREVQLWTDEVSLNRHFSDLTELARSCRFNDCTHEGTPGCALAAAVAAGRLDGARLARYHRLLAEVRALEAQQLDAARRKGRRR